MLEHAFRAGASMKKNVKSSASWKHHAAKIVIDSSAIIAIFDAAERNVRLPGGRDIGISGDPTLPIIHVDAVIEDKKPTTVPGIGEALIELFCTKSRVHGDSQ